METEKNTENVWKAEQKNKENVENQAYQISQERAFWNKISSNYFCQSINWFI